MSTRRPKKDRRLAPGSILFERSPRMAKRLAYESRRNARGSVDWNNGIWTLQDGDEHPQYLTHQPQWRVRKWLRGKTEADRAMAAKWLAAPGRLVRLFFHGLMHRTVL